MDDVRRGLSGAAALRIGLVAMAAVIPSNLIGCGSLGFIGTTAPSFMRNIRESADPNVRYESFTRLADPQVYTEPVQKEEAVRLLSAALASGRESTAIRAAACRTLGALGRPSAAPALRSAVLDPDPIVRSEACRALGKVGSSEDGVLLARIMTTDADRDTRVAAIEALGALQTTDPRIAFLLVEGMKNADPSIRAASYASLKQIAGEDFGLDVEPWETWANERLEAGAASFES